MRIQLKKPVSKDSEDLVVSFYSAVPEKQLIKALSMLDGGQIGAIDIPNHMVSGDLVNKYFPESLYRIKY